MDIECIENFTILSDIVKLGNIQSLLHKYYSSARWKFLEYKDKCTIRSRYTLYYRLLWQTRHFSNDTELYQQPRRGDLSILCRKTGCKIDEYRAGIVWLYLRQAIEGYMRPAYHGSLEFTTLDDGFLTRGLHMRSVMTILSQVCKEWYIVLKYYCVWWGPRGTYFALVPSTAAQIARCNKIR